MLGSFSAKEMPRRPGFSATGMPRGVGFSAAAEEEPGVDGVFSVLINLRLTFRVRK